MNKTYETKDDAKKDGYVFVTAKAIEYVNRGHGKNTGKIQRVDTTPGRSFGYDFSIAAIVSDRVIAKFGATETIWINNAKNKIGRRGAFYANVMKKLDYDIAVNAARTALLNYEETA